MQVRSLSLKNPFLFWNIKFQISPEPLCQIEIKSFDFDWPPYIGGKLLTTNYWLAFFINWFQCKTSGVICCLYMLLNSCRLLSSCTSQVSPTNNKDAELNRQFPFCIDLNRILPVLLKLKTKAEKPDTQFSQHTYGPKTQSGSNLCPWLMNIFIKKLVKENEKY